MGSAAVGAWIAHITFWVLILWAYFTESLGPRASVAFALLWLVPNFALSFWPAAAPFFPSYVALLDIVLVFVLFHGDARLT
jgi:hypothetical protein